MLDPRGAYDWADSAAVTRVALSAAARRHAARPEGWAGDEAPLMGEVEAGEA